MLTNGMLFCPLTNCEKNRIRIMIREIDTSESGIPNPNTFKEKSLVRDLIYCLEFRCYDLDDFIHNIDFLTGVYPENAYCKELESYGLAICKEVYKWRSHNEKCIKLS